MKAGRKIELSAFAGIALTITGYFAADEMGYGLKPATQEAYANALEEEGKSITDRTDFNLGRFTVDEMTGTHLHRYHIIGAQEEMVRRTGHKLDEDPKMDMLAACAITLASVPAPENSPTSLPPVVYEYYKDAANYPAAEQSCLDATEKAATDGEITRIISPETVK